MLYDDAVLECELSAANGVVNWYKNGSPIEENERFCFEEEGTFRSLVILCAELQDSGEYILDAKDDTISFHVTVQGKKVSFSCIDLSLCMSPKADKRYDDTDF